MIIILIGVSGSGKTTLGKRLSSLCHLPFYDGDDFHSPENKKKMRLGTPLSEADRLPWLKRLKALISLHLKSKKSMILACSALRASYRKQLQVSSKCVFVYLKGNYAEIERRLQKRKGHFFHPELLQSQFETLEEPQEGLVLSIQMTPTQMAQKIKATFFLNGVP